MRFTADVIIVRSILGKRGTINFYFSQRDRQYHVEIPARMIINTNQRIIISARSHQEVIDKINPPRESNFIRYIIKSD